MRFDRVLSAAAALMLGAPAGSAPDHFVWVELCDAAHPGRRIPLPVEHDRGPAKACHASCGILPGRRAARGR